MNSNKLSSAKNILTVGFIGLLMALSAFSFSLWQTPQYKSTVKVLAVFNQSNIDTYTASKTANYITGIMGEVIYSDSFIDSVYKNDNNLIDTLGQGSEMRQKNWSKLVKTQILENRGIIIVDVYGEDKAQTNLLASAIGSIIVNQHGLYDGSQDRVAIRMIDTPSIYENWSSAKIISDAGLGLIAGLLIGLTLIIIFPNHKLFVFKRKEQVLFEAPLSAKPESTDSRENEPAVPASQPIAYDNAHDSQTDNAPTKAPNPWLDQYYEENFNDKSNRNI